MTEQPTTTAVIVSGYFSPLHVGHLDLIEAAAALGDELIVIVNNNEQQRAKKGKVIIDEADRLRIVQSLRLVDDAIIAIDDDRTVSATLVHLRQTRPGQRLVFANGGDRIPEFVPESVVCAAHDIELRFSIGGDDKADSSTRINIELGLEETPSATPSDNS